jgi:hypothetical protein
MGTSDTLYREESVREILASWHRGDHEFAAGMYTRAEYAEADRRWNTEQATQSRPKAPRYAPEYLDYTRSWAERYGRQ